MGSQAFQARGDRRWPHELDAMLTQGHDQCRARDQQQQQDDAAFRKAILILLLISGLSLVLPAFFG